MVIPVLNVGSTTRVTPYLSNDMFKYHAMRGVPVNSLVPNGTVQDQDAALASYIVQATSMIDDWLSTSLVASVDTEDGPVNLDRYGMVNFQPRYRPVIALLSFSLGIPGRLTAYTSLDGAQVGDNTIRVPVGPAGFGWNSPQGPIQLGSPIVSAGNPWGMWTYCNGFPVTWLTQAEAAGATTVHVADTTGIIAGKTQLTIQAGRNQFRFIAGAVSTADSSGFGTGAGTVGCPALPYDVPNQVAYPTYVTGMTGGVIEAAVLGTRALIKQTSAGNLSTQVIGQNRSRVLDPLGAGDDLAMMYKLLTSYQVLST